MLLHISKWFLFSFSCHQPKQILLWYSLYELGQAPGDKTHKIVGTSWWLDPPRVFNAQACPHWASSNLSITVQVFLPLHWFSWRSLLQQVLILCIYLSLQVWRQWFAYDLTSLLDLRKDVDFSFCSVFYLLLGQNNSCQTPYMPDQKQDTCFCF